MRVFHLMPWADWVALDRAGPDGEHAPPSLAAEGFVHASLAGQLRGTLAAHFRGAGPLALLELDPKRLGRDLRLEPSRGGALFPHLHRALARRDVLRAWPLDPARGFPLPAEVAPERP